MTTAECWNDFCILGDCDGVKHGDCTGYSWTQPRGSRYDPEVGEYVREIRVANREGLMFRVAFVATGGQAKGWTADRPVVEFYDARIDERDSHQFVSSYYVETILPGADGIDLYGGAREWYLDINGMATVRDWLRVIMTADSEPVRETRVTIDGDVSFPARILTGSRWNGAVLPEFDPETAHEVTEWSNRVNAVQRDAGDVYVWLMWSGDVLYQLDYALGIDEPPEDSRVERTWRGGYPIGAGAWSWADCGGEGAGGDVNDA